MSAVENIVTVTFQRNLYQKSIAGFLVSICLILALPVLASDAAHQSKQNSDAKTQTTTDLRVIVDISGSMKKTDPNNLRRPALRLLAGLIPEGSRAGIWNFGKEVNMAVKVGVVNDAWRDLARKESKNISSIGLFTNIENAMRKASFDWKNPDPLYKRNLILLTDGHVDISQDDKLDTASRKRILKDVLPALEKAQVRIHTIALSDDVDENLLSTLSAYTDGLYKKVSSADDLQKLFLQMLEQSVKLDTLPLKDNQFNVDANVNDMTLLVFNKDKTHPTTIVTPAKKTWDKKSHQEQLKWFSDDGFDLVTIKKPQQGRWKIMAPHDESNRVVVATNLKLKLNDLPGYAMLGDVFNVKAQLHEENKPVTDKRLLSKFKFTLKRVKSGADEQLYPMSKVVGDESTYAIQLPPIFKSGDNTFVIHAKSPTAEREVRHQLTVYSVPATVKISDDYGDFKIAVIPHTNLIRPDSIKITSEIEEKNKYILVQYGNEWVFNVDKKHKGKIFTINIDGIRADGKPMSVSFNKVLEASGEAQALKLDIKNEPVDIEKVAPIHKTELVQTKKEVIEHKSDKPDKQKISEDEKESEVNWTLVIISSVIGNLLIVGILGGGYVYMKRRKKKMTAMFNAEMNDDEESEKEDKLEKNSEKKSKEGVKENK